MQQRTPLARSPHPRRVSARVARRPDLSRILRLFAALLLGLLSTHVARAAQLDDASGRLEQELVARIGYVHAEHQRRLKAAVLAYRDRHFHLALRQFHALARVGEAEAQFYLGQMYDLGQGVAADPVRAFSWYHAAARQGHLDAQHNLAIAYAEGLGVRADIHKAVRWWIQSADQGNIDAQYNLGMVFIMGHGDLPPNPAQAVRWWRKAAVNGDALAQYNLGTLYANGEGTRTNYCEAVRWWRRSAANGMREAEQLLAQVRKQANFSRCW